MKTSTVASPSSGVKAVMSTSAFTFSSSTPHHRTTVSVQQHNRSVNPCDDSPTRRYIITPCRKRDWRADDAKPSVRYTINDPTPT